MVHRNFLEITAQLRPAAPSYTSTRIVEPMNSRLPLWPKNGLGKTSTFSEWSAAGLLASGSAQVGRNHQYQYQPLPGFPVWGEWVDRL